jgi:hypothetical protein
MNASVSQSEDALHSMEVDAASRSNSAIVSEGVLAGVIAASAVALVFLILDVLGGHAFRTPRQLGVMLLGLFGGGGADAGESATPLALYTLFHFLAFILAGILAAAIVQVAMKKPVALLLFVILFFAFEVAFTGFVAYLDSTSSTGMTPMQVGIGNVVASIAMAVFFTLRHPNLRSIGRTLSAEE